MLELPSNYPAHSEKNGLNASWRKGWSQAKTYLVGDKIRCALDKIHVVLRNTDCSSSNPMKSMLFLRKSLILGDGDFKNFLVFGWITITISSPKTSASTLAKTSASVSPKKGGYPQRSTSANSRRFLLPNKSKQCPPSKQDLRTTGQIRTC